jgi:RNA polymerase sigma-70 factor (ECF subfamily)
VRGQTAHMLAVARRFFRNEDDARDAVQDAFLSAFRALDRFEGACRLSTWLHRIVVNACLMKLRARRRKPEQAIDDLLPTFKVDGHHTATFVDWSPTIHEVLEREETRALVRECIGQLPETYRTALLARDIEGMELEDIAAMLNVTPNAVKIRVHRARQALRSLVDPHFRQENRP